MRWIKCSETLPTPNDIVVIRHELFGKSCINIAKFVQYTDLHEGIQQQWLIYSPLYDTIYPIATLRNQDILCWHGIAQLLN